MRKNIWALVGLVFIAMAMPVLAATLTDTYPQITDTYVLGSAALRWKSITVRDVYGTNFYEAGTAFSSKYMELTDSLAWTQVTGYNLNTVWSGKLDYRNITSCSNGQILKMSGSAWACSADEGTGNGYNSSYEYWKNQSLMTNKFNSSYEYWSNQSLMVTYNSSYITNSFNSSYNSQLDHNTTQEIFLVSDNGTFHRLNNTMTLGNISNPINCSAGQYVFGKTGIIWQCRADLAFNSSYLTFTYNFSYDYRTNNTLMIAYNASYDYRTNNSLQTTTFNASYNSQLDHNTTTEIRNTLNQSNIVVTKSFNTTSFVNASKIETTCICMNSTCLANITYNGTGIVIYG